MAMHEFLAIFVAGMIDLAVIFFITFVAWCLVKFEKLRDHFLESAQDGDGKTHWADGRNVVSLTLGLFCSWATFNIIMIYVHDNVWPAGALVTVGTLVAASFTLLGIAWKKP